MCVCACDRVCTVCMRACVRACMHIRVCVCACVRACARACECVRACAADAAPGTQIQSRKPTRICTQCDSSCARQPAHSCRQISKKGFNTAPNVCSPAGGCVQTRCPHVCYAAAPNTHPLRAWLAVLKRASAFTASSSPDTCASRQTQPLSGEGHTRFPVLR